MTWLSATGTAGRWPASKVTIQWASGFRSRCVRPFNIRPTNSEQRIAGQWPAVPGGTTP
jgi:hypothetical protein